MIKIVILVFLVVYAFQWKGSSDQIERIRMERMNQSMDAVETRIMENSLTWKRSIEALEAKIIRI